MKLLQSTYDVDTSQFHDGGVEVMQAVHIFLEEFNHRFHLDEHFRFLKSNKQKKSACVIYVYAKHQLA